MTPAQWNEYQRQADVIDEHKKNMKEPIKSNQTMNEKKLVTIYESNDGGKTYSSRKIDINAIKKSSNNSKAQLPKEISDEEIEEAGKRLVDDEYEFNAFIIGAKWYREQLKQRI